MKRSTLVACHGLCGPCRWYQHRPGSPLVVEGIMIAPAGIVFYDIWRVRRRAARADAEIEFKSFERRKMLRYVSGGVP